MEITKENLIAAFGVDDGELFWDRFTRQFNKNVKKFEDHFCQIDKQIWERYKKSQAPESPKVAPV